ncbi:MAG: hypothetical protein IJ422_06840 [Oscillospiraceae bacterium]|nr:hypothetical protein [Oscillospiraceae bacterium]
MSPSHIWNTTPVPAAISAARAGISRGVSRLIRRAPAVSAAKSPSASHTAP